MSEAPNFIDACLAGDALAADADDWIDIWHDAAKSSPTSQRTLAEHLGMTEDEYKVWVERPEVLRFILKSRMTNAPVRTVELLGSVVAAAARADNDAEAAGVVEWLRKTGRI